MCKLRQSFTHVVFLVLSVLFVAVGAQAFPVRMMDVKEMLDESDAVYKITVQSTREEGVWTRDPTTASLKLPRVIAKTKVISTIKGTPRDSIEIQFPGFPHTGEPVFNWPMYTALSAGKTYVVFLKSGFSPARFADSQTGAMVVPAKSPARSYGNRPEDKMLAELVSAAQGSDKDMTRFAVEQLGKLGDIRAADVLRGLSKTSDQKKRTAALVARIRLGDAPDQKDLLDILRLYPADMKSRGRAYMGNRGPFYSTPEQWDIVEAVYVGVETKHGKRMKSFDYVGFVAKAIQCRVIKENDILRSDLVGALRAIGEPRSLPLLVKLLDDPAQVVRYMAATSFAVLAKDNKWFPASDIFDKNEAKYIKHCREWAKEHPDGI